MAERMTRTRPFRPVRRVRQMLYDSELMRGLFHMALFVVGLLVALMGAYIIGMTDYGIFVVGGMVSLVLGVVMVVRPDIGMFILLASLYTNSSDVLEVAFGIPDTNKLLVAVTFVSVIGTRAIIQRKPLRFGATEIVIILYAAFAVVSLFAVGEVGDALDNIIDFAKDIAIMLILVQLAGDEQTWKRMHWVLIVCAGILASMTAFQTLTGNYEFEFWGYAKAPVHEVVEGFDSARPTGPLDDPNYYSQLLIMIMPLALYRALTEERPRNKLIAGYFWIVIVMTIVFSYSRGAFLALVVLHVIVAIERKMNLFKVGLGAAALLIAVTPVLPKGYLDRLATLGGVFTSTEMQTESSFEGRTSEALAAWMMFMDHPLTGVGYGLYEENYLEYSIRLGIDGRLEARAAHSLYLEVMAETGVLGMVTFVLMIGTFIVVSQRSIKRLEEIGRDDLVPWVRGIQLGFLAYSLTSVFLHDDWVRFYRLSLALMASSAAMTDIVVRRYQEQQAKVMSHKRVRDKEVVAVP